MIRLEKWPTQRMDALKELYEHADQSHCLVRIRVPLDVSATRNYFRAIRSENVNGKPFLCYAIHLDDAIIGKIEASKDIEEDGELDLILKKEYSLQGYGTEALRQFMKMLEEKQWCRRMTAYVDSENKAMIRVLEKNGFEKKRNFCADVMAPSGNAYSLRIVAGSEYVYEFSADLVVE